MHARRLLARVRRGCPDSGTARGTGLAESGSPAARDRTRALGADGDL